MDKMDLRDGKIYIIAEIGGNFTDFPTAKKLIDEAKESGVDAVKFQTYRGNTIASRQAIFDMENMRECTQSSYFEQYEIDEETHRRIFEYARGKGLDIFSTPSHKTDLLLLEKFSPNVYKIGGDDLTNLPFLKEVARLGKPIIISTGMGTLQEVKEAVNAILEEGNDDIVIMHVVSLYPTAPQYVNLEAIHTLQQAFPQFVIGYSDHTLGVDSCIFSAAMGARVIEKHFTYDKNADGPDHMLSATKEEMKLLVDKVRLFETMRGNGIKKPMGDEIKNRRNNRKSVVCVRDIKQGEMITGKDIDIKRPGNGILPKYRDMVIGRRAGHDISADTVLTWADFI